MSDFFFQATVRGRPGILKNGKKLVRNKRTGKMFPISNDKYKAWEDEAIKSITMWMNAVSSRVEFPHQGPVHLKGKFYYKDKRTPDLSNVLQGIEDVLQKCGVIEDDKQIKSHDGTRIIIDPALDMEFCFIELHSFKESMQEMEL